MSGRARPLALGLALGLGACAGPASTRHPSGAAPASASRILSGTTLFEFHSGFWLNLHHVLYALGARERAARGEHLWLAPPVELAPEPSELSGAEQETWSAAVHFYAEHWAAKDLLFDPELYAIKRALAAHEDDTHLTGVVLAADTQRVLEGVASIYRRTRWREHDAGNRRWLGQQLPGLRADGAALAQACADVFLAPWPTPSPRVDLVPLANGGGAYTSIEQGTHTVLGTLDPRDTGLAGEEILFHEASHALAAPLRAALARAAQENGRPAPGELWHAVLFFGVGELLRARHPGYVPYVSAQGLWTRVWASFFPAIESTWPAYLLGAHDAESLERASTHLLRALGPTAGR